MTEKLEEGSPKSYSLAVRFCYDLLEELEYHKSSRKYLAFNEYKVLEAYYNRLNSRNIGHVAHCEARLRSQATKYIGNCAQSARILDAGCGLGSEAIFFGLLGMNVTGVDLNRERLGIADKRVKYYEEKYGMTLHIKFCLKSILKLCEYNEFDIIWSNQSISHIHPTQIFLEVALKALKSGGCLIICDSNGMNPYVAFHSWLIHRKCGTYTSVEDPDTRMLIPYAQERMLNPLILRSFLKTTHSKYKMQLVGYHGFVPSQSNTQGMFRVIEEVSERIPVVRTIGGTYIMVCKKVD